jgi:hypothetical protein
VTESIETEAHRVLIVGADGPPIADADAARDLIGDALGEGARVVAVPVERLDPTFFQLRTGFAGELLQKMVNYRLKFAVIGDISEHVAASDALRDFVVECNRGHDIFFVNDVDELKQRLASV